MTAPCPALGFVVLIEPAAGLGESEREASQRTWLALRAELRHAWVGDLEDLSVRSES